MRSANILAPCQHIGSDLLASSRLYQPNTFESICEETLNDFQYDTLRTGNERASLMVKPEKRCKSREGRHRPRLSWVGLIRPQLSNTREGGSYENACSERFRSCRSHRAAGSILCQCQFDS